MKHKKYRSRISVLLSIIIVAAFVPSILPAFEVGTPLVAILVVAIAPLFVLFCFLSTIYTIKNDKLVIKSIGITMANIDITNIRSIKRSYNPLSSPAVSLKRLNVTYYSKGRELNVLISPVREKEFIEQLKAINPNITANIYDNTNILHFWDWDI